MSLNMLIQPGNSLIFDFYIQIYYYNYIGTTKGVQRIGQSVRMGQVPVVQHATSGKETRQNVRASKALQIRHHNQINQLRKENTMRHHQDHFEAAGHINFVKTFNAKLGTLTVACALQMGSWGQPVQPCVL